MKFQIKGQRFQDTVEIQTECQVVYSFTKQEFWKRYKKWGRGAGSSV
jgi:hypothetical protein